MNIVQIEQWFDEKAAARILGVAPRTLRAWRKAGRIGHATTPTGRIRYTVGQLLTAQEKGKVERIASAC